MHALPALLTLRTPAARGVYPLLLQAPKRKAISALAGDTVAVPGANKAVKAVVDVEDGAVELAGRQVAPPPTAVVALSPPRAVALTTIASTTVAGMRLGKAASASASAVPATVAAAPSQSIAPWIPAAASKAGATEPRARARAVDKVEKGSSKSSARARLQAVLDTHRVALVEAVPDSVSLRTTVHFRCRCGQPVASSVGRLVKREGTAAAALSLLCNPCVRDMCH